MSAIDLGSILDNVNQSFNAAIGTIQGAGQAQSDAYKENAALQIDAGNATALINKTADLAKLTAQNAVQQTATQIGAGMDPASMAHIADLMAQNVSALHDQNTLRDQIQQNQETSIWDDPLGWIQNKFTTPNLIQKYNDAVDRSNAVENEMAGMTKLMDERTKQANMVASTVTQGTVDAHVQLIKDQAQIAANDSMIRAAAANADSVQKIASLRLEDMQANAKVVEVDMQRQQLAIAQAHLALSQQEFDWRKKEKELGDSYGAYLQQTIQTGLKALYPNNPAAWQLDTNSPKIQLMIAGKIPMDPILKDALIQGESNTRINANYQTAPRIITGQPSDYLDVVTRNKVDVPDAQKLSLGIVKNTADTLAAGGLPPGGTPAQLTAYQEAVQKKDYATVNKIVSGIAQTRLDQYSASAMSPDNPYSLPSLNQITKQAPALQETQTYQKVFAPAIASKADIGNPSIALGLVSEAISHGVISMTQAAQDLATMYKNGQQVNVSSRNLVNQGYTPSLKYNYPLENPGADLGTTPVDMTDASAIQRYLVQQKTAHMKIFD